MTPKWEKALHPWANAQAKSYTYAADAAEDTLTMSAKNDVQHAATEKPKP